jgi:hypothetical protein
MFYVTFYVTWAYPGNCRFDEYAHAGTSPPASGGHVLRRDDHDCPDFELHRQQLLDELDSERRSFDHGEPADLWLPRSRFFSGEPSVFWPYLIYNNILHQT